MNATVTYLSTASLTLDRVALDERYGHRVDYLPTVFPSLASSAEREVNEEDVYGISCTTKARGVVSPKRIEAEYGSDKGRRRLNRDRIEAGQ